MTTTGEIRRVAGIGWFYKLHAVHSSPIYKTEAAARGAMKKHILRGGLTTEWYRRNADAVLLAIAQSELFGLETLESRGSDSLDFRDVGVVQLRDMLRKAYEAGRASR